MIKEMLKAMALIEQYCDGAKPKSEQFMANINYVPGIGWGCEFEHRVYTGEPDSFWGDWKPTLYEAVSAAAKKISNQTGLERGDKK